ncbi:MAG: helicase HerA-like domain-containing protein, partial [Candidatus Micrarchaeota archaeon]
LDELVSTNQRGISPSSISVIQRKLLSLEESGLGKMFGQPSISIPDILGLNVLNLSDARRDMSVSLAPAFLLQKLFDHLPEVGEVDMPEFVIFFDEAHYLFKDANRSLKDLMVTLLKQIRSKGVSVFFVTQDVTDIPDEILGQLSTKIIFSQKPMTKSGNSRLKALASSFPNPKPGTLETIKSMPPGTALLSTLDMGGNQTEAMKVKVFAPATTMQVVPDASLRKATDKELIAKYSKPATSKPRTPTPQPRKVPQPELLAPEKRLSIAHETSIFGKRGPKPKPAKQAPEKPTKKGPSLLDSLLKGLLKIFGFFLKIGAMLMTAIIIKPAKSFFKYLVKKPVRL